MARPTKWSNEIVGKLEEGFIAGLNVSQACFYAGISRDTYYSRLTAEPEFSDRMKQCKESLIIQSKLNIASAINNGDVNLSKWYINKASLSYSPSDEANGDLVMQSSYEDNQRPVHKAEDTFGKSLKASIQDFAPYFCISFVVEILAQANSEQSVYDEDEKQAIYEYADNSNSLDQKQLLSDAVAYFNLAEVDDLVIDDQLRTMTVATRWELFVRSSDILPVLFNEQELGRLEYVEQTAALA
jgi:hypothetical protein